MSARWLTEDQVAAYQRKRAGQLSAPSLVAPPAKRVQRSELEAELQRQIKVSVLPQPQYDVPYLVGTRHRLDACWQEFKFGVEVQGGVHRIKGKFHVDIRKRAQSLLQGWRVLEVDRDAIYSGDALHWITLLLEGLRHEHRPGHQGFSE